jgi:hypothetical protein
MCSTRFIQCAAATQDTHLVPSSGNSKMSSDCKEAAGPLASFPFWSKSYAEFVMDKELMEAKAAAEECYRRRASRAGLEETLPTDRPMTEQEIDELSEKLGDGKGSRAKRAREIEEMTIEDMEAEIRETNAIIRRRRRAGTGLLPMPLALPMCLMGSSVDGFTAYDCSNRSNVVEAYSLLEPDACANMGKDGEVETTVYGESVQIKQDRMIPVFRCVVVETLVAQYCGMFSAAGVTRYIRFRELKPLEAWECRKARRSGQIIINGRTVKGKIGATASHSMFLAGGLDDESRCEVGMVTLSDGKVLNGLVAQGLYEITLREEFARLNELTGSLTLSSGVQASAADKSIVDSLEGTVVWEYDSMACPQTIVRLYRGMMKAYVNQTNTYEGSTVVVEHQDKDRPSSRPRAGEVVHLVWAPGLQDPHQEHSRLHPQGRPDGGGPRTVLGQGRGRRPHQAGVGYVLHAGASFNVNEREAQAG